MVHTHTHMHAPGGADVADDDDDDDAIHLSIRQHRQSSDALCVSVMIGQRDTNTDRSVRDEHKRAA
jgi:hypothetical protein